MPTFTLASSVAIRASRSWSSASVEREAHCSAEGETEVIAHAWVRVLSGSICVSDRLRLLGDASRSAVRAEEEEDGREEVPA